MKTSQAIILSVSVIFLLTLSGPSGAEEPKGPPPAKEPEQQQVTSPVASGPGVGIGLTEKSPAEKPKQGKTKAQNLKSVKGQGNVQKPDEKAPPKKDTQEKNKIIAKVGTYTLTGDMLDKRIEALPPQYKQMIAQKPEFKKNLIDRWVQVSLLAQEARARGMDKDKSVLEKIDEVMNTLLAQEFVMRNVIEKIEITDKEISEYYDGHKSEFENPEMVKARHILIKVAHDATPEQWQEAEKKALDTKKRLDGGEDFAAVAKSVSDDPGSKEKGGDLGFFPRGQMVPEFENAAFSLNIGVICEPVKSKFGYHIIRVEEKREPKTKLIEEVSAGIKNSLTETKQQEDIDRLISDLTKKYGVTVDPSISGSREKPGPKGKMGARINP
ncbi:MAG: peptidylprolyl isomerase [Pseudomonadota bacterium]